CASLYPSLLDGCPTTPQKENSSLDFTTVSLIREQVIFIFVILFLLSSTIGVEKLLILFSDLCLELLESITELVKVFSELVEVFLSSVRVVLYDILLGL